MAEEKSGKAVETASVYLMGMRTEQFCKVTLAEFAPNGKSAEIKGKNRQGKTSEVNSLWAAIGGPAALTEMGITKPVKEGADAAKIYVDLDEILVYREFSADGKMKLIVTNRDGFKMEPGQTVLDTFKGKFFDLSHFYRMDPDKRLELVLSLIDLGGLDLKEWKTAKDAVYLERRDVNRDLKALEAQLKAAPEVEAPDEEKSVHDIAEEQQKAQLKLDEHNGLRQQLKDKAHERNLCKDSITIAEGNVADLEAQIQGLQSRLEAERGKLTTLNSDLERINKEGKTIQDEVEALVDPDMSGYAQRIADVDQINVRVRQKKARAELQKQVDAKRAESDKLTLTLAAFDKKREDAIKAADFPVIGMGFDDTDITFNGMPFSQSSDMERLVVGYGIAKALSPRFRVMRLSRPGDLDPDNLEALYEMAELDGIQILTEQVSAGGSGGLEIVDGVLEGGTTEGVQKIMELAKPKRQKAAEAKEAAAGAVKKVVSDEELDALYEETVTAKGGKGAKAAKGKATPSASADMPAAAPVEL